MTNKLMQVIAENMTIAFEDKGGVDDNGVPQITLKEEGHTANHKPILDALIAHLVENDKAGADAVVKHTGKTLRESVKLAPPFVTLLLAAGHIKTEDYFKKILEAPKDAEIVANYVPEDKFVQMLFESYRTLAKTELTPQVVTFDDFSLELPKGEALKTLNSIMESYKLPSLNKIAEKFSSVSSIYSQFDDLTQSIAKERKAMDRKEKSLQSTLAKLSNDLRNRPMVNTEVKAVGPLPAGKIVMKKVSDIFPIDIKTDFEVPTWEWEGTHPDVPKINPHYIFREELLMRVLYALVTNQRMYIHGHTGSGKTTVIEQVAAYLNWPFARINFDSEITRMDLIGRDTLKDGQSTFVDGMLPRFMSQNYITVFDEIDFCRPDVAYVMQAATEGNSFVITEDGGRVVTPHPMFRMFATGNTVGQGDENGMYQGARPQSLAFLDRFTIWAQVDYLDDQQRTNLLRNHYPALNDKEVNTIIQYSTEHLTAFTQARILQPISPRGILALGEAVSHLNMAYPKAKDNLSKALYMTVVDRATSSDRAVIKGIVDRVVKS